MTTTNITSKNFAVWHQGVVSFYNKLHLPTNGRSQEAGSATIENLTVPSKAQHHAYLIREKTHLTLVPRKESWQTGQPHQSCTSASPERDQTQRWPVFQAQNAG